MGREKQNNNQLVTQPIIHIKKINSCNQQSLISETFEVISVYCSFYQSMHYRTVFTGTSCSCNVDFSGKSKAEQLKFSENRTKKNSYEIWK